MAVEAEAIDYVISTVEVDPKTLDKLDTKNSVRDKDGTMVRLPSQSNPCTLQLWEVFVATSVLLVQPQSSIINAHIKALCSHNESKYLCEAVLKEHTSIGCVTDTSQDVSLYSFLDEYLGRKFNITFPKLGLLRYVVDAMDDPLCSKSRIPRVYLLAPYVQAMLLNSQFFENQYDELIDAMRMANLPVNDVLQEGDMNEIGDAVEIHWDNAALYDDPNMVLKKHGGWATTRGSKMLTPKDQLMQRLTGCTMDQILAGQDVPDSPREQASQANVAQHVDRQGMPIRHRGEREVEGEEEEDSVGSSHLSDYDVDPEHPKVVPFGLTLSEMYLLLCGLLTGQKTTSSARRGCVVGQRQSSSRKDSHILASAVLIDLYIRDRVEIAHWTMTEGNVAVPYRAHKTKGRGYMNHYLDAYVPYVESIFRDMRLPKGIREAPIWANLEARGVLENHRTSRERAYLFGWSTSSVWDLARPDILLDLKEGYHLGAQVLYDKTFKDPFHEASNDVLMFCYLLQGLFDRSFDFIDGMVRVLNSRCPPFVKGELFPPVTMVHGGSVCLGLVDRGFRIATLTSTQLADEAAEFNELVMERLEKKFFLSPDIWKSFDADDSGELSLDEFVEGMRGVSDYKEFRKERVPEEVLRLIVSDLAERLFREVDVNGDGTLTPDELQGAFKRRRDEAIREREKHQWLRRLAISTAQQIGFIKKQKEVDERRTSALKKQWNEQQKATLQESRRRREWASEVDNVEFRDEDVDQ